MNVQHRNGHLFCLVCRWALFSVHCFFFFFFFFFVLFFFLLLLFFFLFVCFFFLYINDIMVGIESEIRLSAHDCVCYRQIGSIEDVSKLKKFIDQLGK